MCNLEILGEFILAIEKSIIPPNVPRHITEAIIKINGERWEVHKNDQDPFPSSPHAHNYEANLKLHLGNGQLFNKGKKIVGNIGEKKLLWIREIVQERINGIILPDLAI